MSDTGCSRVISVLAFYVFSCSCFYGSQPRKPSRQIRNESQLLWREEIESGPIPSFLKNNCRKSSRDPCCVNSRASTPSSAKATSRFSVPLKPRAEPQPLESIESHPEKTKCRRITTVTISELPKIHPAINDRHLPVVSELPGSRTATTWMTLPPPPARVMRAINRATHIRRTSQRFRTGSSMDKPEVTLVENIEQQQHSVRGECDKDLIASPKTPCTTAVQDKAKETLHSIPSPTFSTLSGADYECRYLDPTAGATKKYTLSYDEFLGQTPPSSTTTFVGVIRRPPPVFMVPLSPPRDHNEFEDIYG